VVSRGEGIRGIRTEFKSYKACRASGRRERATRKLSTIKQGNARMRHGRLRREGSVQENGKG